MSDRAKVVLVVALVAVYVALALAFEDRLATDFWPPDRSTIGPNIIASLIWIVPSFAAGLMTGRRLWRKHQAHSEWMARHVAANHRAVTGREPDPHPHFNV